LLRQCDLRDVGSLSQGFSDAPPTKYREIVMEFAGELKRSPRAFLIRKRTLGINSKPSKVSSGHSSKHWGTTSGILLRLPHNIPAALAS
jgi:hypothetical protein